MASDGIDVLRLEDLPETLPMALLRGREAVMQVFRPILRQHQLTEQQWRILRVLARNGEQEITDLAAEAFILPSNLSRILPNLEARDLCLRRQVSTDMRRCIIQLSPEGQALVENIVPEMEAAYERIAHAFGKGSMLQLIELALKLEGRLGAEQSSDR